MTTEITDTRDSIESRIAHYDGYNSDSFEDNLALMAEARAKCPVARSSWHPPSCVLYRLDVMRSAAARDQFNPRVPGFRV